MDNSSRVPSCFRKGPPSRDAIINKGCNFQKLCPERPVGLVTDENLCPLVCIRRDTTHGYPSLCFRVAPPYSFHIDCDIPISNMYDFITLSFVKNLIVHFRSGLYQNLTRRRGFLDSKFFSASWFPSQKTLLALEGKNKVTCIC